MEKFYIEVERRMGAVMIVAGVVAIVLGTINWLWHLWMIGGMLVSLGREIRK